jgi:uncharacterized protein YndB with AHSA1/START domain
MVDRYGRAVPDHRRQNAACCCRSTAMQGQASSMPAKDHAMTDNTVRLHRVLRCSPDKVYRAFLQPDAMSKWLPPYGYTCNVQQMDARVGGTFRMSFRDFTSGYEHAFGGEYLALQPGSLIRYTDRFDDPNLPGVMTVTVVLTAVSCGTDVSIEQSGIPAAIPLEMCHLGWQESLLQLAKLVEPPSGG